MREILERRRPPRFSGERITKHHRIMNKTRAPWRIGLNFVHCANVGCSNRFDFQIWSVEDYKWELGRSGFEYYKLRVGFELLVCGECFKKLKESE